MEDDAKLAVKRLIDTFNDGELFEAHAVFEYLAWRARQRGESDKLYRAHAVELNRCDWFERFEDFMENFGLRHVFDLLKLGQSLAVVEFKKH